MDVAAAATDLDTLITFTWRRQWLAATLNPSSTDFTLFAADGPDRLGQIEGYEAAQIVARFNDVSTWQLTAATDTPGARLLLEAEHPRLVVETTPEMVFRSGPVTHIERQTGADGDLVTFSGVDDLIYLRHRLAHPEPGTAAPPYDTQAFDTRTGPASAVIAGFVDANAGEAAHADRRVPGLTVPVPADLGPDITVSARYQNLLTMIQRLAARARLGIEIRDLEFFVFEPAGPRAVFSSDLGTLAGWSETVEAPAVNHVYVAGGGRGVNRIIREYSDGESVAAWGRIEGFDDRRDTTVTAELDQAGEEVLAGDPHPRGAAGGPRHPLPAVHHRLAAGGPGDRRLRRGGPLRRHPPGRHLTAGEHPAPHHPHPGGSALMQLDVFRRLDDLDRRVRQLERTEPGDASLVSAEWRYSTAATLPPDAGGFRTNTTPVTAIHINKIDEAGYTRGLLGLLVIGDVITLRFANGNTAVLEVTADIVDNGTYWTIPVSVLSGDPIANKGQLTTVIAALETP